MKEKTLLKIALITSLAGLFILYIVSETIPISETAIDDVDKSDFGKDVKITGFVNKVVVAGNITIIEIEQPKRVSIVLADAVNVNLSEGSTIEVIGKISEYKGKTQIRGTRVRVIY